LSPSSLNLQPWRAALLCAVLAFGLAGCGDRDRLSYATETDEPYYREGESLLKTGRRQEALTAFLKVIDKRGEDAPESHLEIGLLYLQYINDPLSAIYHFKKYLALRPNSPLAPVVRQRIDAAIREFARTLPAQPLDNAARRVDLIAAMDKLKLENDQLKQQLADLKTSPEAAAALTVNTRPSPVAPAESAPENQLSFSFDPMPTVRTRPAQAAPTPPPSAVTPPPVAVPPAARRETARAKPAGTPAAPNSPAHAAARKHVVQKGDTLSNLAQRYYKNRAKWRDIYAANRKLMKSESDIRVGMELVIP
jgi:tetratricopeptide (TPR) repeat protein